MGEIHFTEEAWEQVRDYTELCPVEVACMGYATLVDDVVEVSEVFLVPQTVSSASVEFMDEGFPWAVAKALKEGRLDELRFCWHSHVNFGAAFSSTDKDMVRKVHNSGPIPWFASAILNKKGETWGQLDYFKPEGELANFASHITVPLDVTHGDWIDIDMTEREEELEKFLTKKPTTTVTKSAGKDVKNQTKTAATKADEKLDSKEERPGPSGCTGADWKLHNLAKQKAWASYIDPEHYVHYWDENDGNKYKGCAPMPKNPDGSFKLDIEFSVIDSDTVDEIEEAFGPRDEDEIDAAVEKVMAREEGRLH